MGIFHRMGQAIARRTTRTMTISSTGGGAPAHVVERMDQVETMLVQTGVSRSDGWYSALSGYGKSNRDPRTTLQVQPQILTDEFVEWLWRDNDIAARIIEDLPNEALRPGYELKMQDKDLAERVMARSEELSLKEKFLKALQYERGYGGALIFPVINDLNKDLTQPLNENRVSEVQHLLVFEPREVRPIEWYTEMTDAKLGEPRIFEMRPLHGQAHLNFDTMLIHESRVVSFPGIQVSRGQFTRNGWGDSYMSRCWEIVRDYGVAWEAVATLLHQFAMAVFKIKGLAKLIAQDKDDVVRKRIETILLSQSSIGATMMDAEQEEYERKQTPVTGMKDLLDGFAHRLAAAADMPVTRLLGSSPAGMNATGESDMRNWYDRIDVRRQIHMEPRMRRLFELIMLSRGGPTGGGVPTDPWSVEFLPLWQESDKERADTRKTVAETDKIYVDIGAVSPEEVAVSHFGGDTYSPDLTIADEDLEARERSAEEGEFGDDEVGDTRLPEGVEGEAGAGENVQQTVFNGAQVTSLVEVVSKVNAHEISRESGVAILRIAFGLSEGDAEAVIGEEPEPLEPDANNPNAPNPVPDFIAGGDPEDEGGLPPGLKGGPGQPPPPSGDEEE